MNGHNTRGGRNLSHLLGRRALILVLDLTVQVAEDVAHHDKLGPAAPECPLELGAGLLVLGLREGDQVVLLQLSAAQKREQRQQDEVQYGLWDGVQH